MLTVVDSSVHGLAQQVVTVGLFTVSPVELASGYAVGAIASVGGGGSLSL